MMPDEKDRETTESIIRLNYLIIPAVFPIPLKRDSVKSRATCY
jgi:hypothetical protein